ncbi:lysosomal alpha-mannosidase-like isoform X2 [Rhodnius prolixus]|uniref:lysosomal alpha-mannosidase-like isoform X2 n=1 Tax=Rhodnius prolixus TaxID=13249 RepID=UPI003D18E1E9
MYLILKKCFVISVSMFCFGYARYPCPSCAKKGCHQVKPDKLNIHLIPHTHDDAGWLKTVDQYYYGGHQRHAPFGVQYIIDSVLAELEVNETRRFTYVESAFLWRWWNDRGEYHREKLRKLVKQGRLQITHGGWVMSDEATTHYTALIHQMSFGLKFIQETFGDCSFPNVAWQVDPFGHSSEVGLQFADMGYDAVFFGRIDRDDYNRRLDDRTLEMVWRPDPEIGPDGDLFTSILYNLYMPPDGFCFDVFCNDEPIMDNPNMHGNNVKRRVSSFVSYAKQWASAYRTNNVMITMGGDFNYMVAGSWFVNMDKLIKYGNEYYSEVNILYSTPSCYVQSLLESDIIWPFKDRDDFFPYSSYEGKYWTGYYTSRPSLKYLAHKVNQLLMASSSLLTFLRLDSENNSLFYLQRVVALLQHHDAISGTEKQHVANDYKVYLQEAVTTAEDIFTNAFRKCFGEHYRHQHFCMKTNVSECKLSEERSMFMVHLYNPLGHSVDMEVRLPVPLGQYSVLSHQGSVENELIPLPRQVLQLAERKSSAKHDLFFIAKDLAPLGITSYYVKRENLIDPNVSSTAELLEETDFNDTVVNGMLTVDNFGLCQLVFNTTSGLLTSIVLDNEPLDFEQNFFYYAGKRNYDYRASGAYTFSTSNQYAKVVASKVTLRLYAVDVSLKRRRNWRSTWKFYGYDIIASNYYPVTSAARIGDENTCLTVLTDRAQGAASLQDGEIEFMLHRRLTTDDGKGVLEPLNEVAHSQGLVVRGTHTLQFVKNAHGCQGEAAVKHRTTALSISSGPWISLNTAEVSADIETVELPIKMKSMLNSSLPKNVHILSLERRSNNTMLLRLEHIFERDEHSTLSLPATVTLTDLFKHVTVQEVVEFTLDGNRPKHCVQRAAWKHNGTSFRSRNKCGSLGNLFSVILHPMEIKTLLLTILEL